MSGDRLYRGNHHRLKRLGYILKTLCQFGVRKINSWIELVHKYDVYSPEMNLIREDLVDSIGGADGPRAAKAILECLT